MIIFVGDIHGEFRIFDYIKEHIDIKPTDTIIQIGDFGFWPGFREKWVALDARVLAIDGNHEHFDAFSLLKNDKVTEMADNLFYVPRGTVMEIEGYRVGFMGGGESVDKAYRTKVGIYKDWFPEERVTDADVNKLLAAVGDGIDLLVTHCPPRSVIMGAFPPLDRQDWGLPPEWKDESAICIDWLNNMLGVPIICGHMHKSVVFGNCRILDINEVYIYPDKSAE